MVRGGKGVGEIIGGGGIERVEGFVVWEMVKILWLYERILRRVWCLCGCGVKKYVWWIFDKGSIGCLWLGLMFILFRLSIMGWGFWYKGKKLCLFVLVCRKYRIGGFCLDVIFWWREKW